METTAIFKSYLFSKINFRKCANVVLPDPCPPAKPIIKGFPKKTFFKKINSEIFK